MAAMRGARMMLVLSPTPPVECLSIFMPGMSLVSRVEPDLSMAFVRAIVSSSVMPLMQAAIRSAEAW
jgi:hypothetical protein